MRKHEGAQNSISPLVNEVREILATLDADEIVNNPRVIPLLKEVFINKLEELRAAKENALSDREEHEIADTILQVSSAIALMDQIQRTVNY
jgi:hypothetical protein